LNEPAGIEAKRPKPWAFRPQRSIADYAITTWKEDYGRAPVSVQPELKIKVFGQIKESRGA